MKSIDIGNEFYIKLVNRNKQQGDGKYTAIEFRTTYLQQLDNEEAWKDSSEFIMLDFSNVTMLGPSFSNEAFAYFTKFEKASPEKILKKIKFTNITDVKKAIIIEELNLGYKGKQS